MKFREKQMGKINNFLFGELHTFEDDPFYWLLDWGTMLFRRLLQRALSKVLFWTINVICLIFIYFLCLTKPTKEAIGEYLATIGIAILVMTSYGTTMRNYSTMKKVVKFVIPFYQQTSRRPSLLLRKRIFRFSSTLKKYTYTYLAITLICYILFLSTTNIENQFAYIVFEKVVHGLLILKIPFFLFVLPHGFIYAFVPTFINCYFNWHGNFMLEALNEQMDKLINFEMEYNNVTDHLECTEYQGIIKKEMTYFCEQFIKIRMCVNQFNKFFKWRFLAIAFSGGVCLGAQVVFLLVVRTKNVVPYLGTLITGFILFTVAAEGGQQLENKSTNIYNQAQRFKWYQWNKGNKQLLLILSLQTKEPLTIHCHGFVRQNRELLLQVLRMIHGYITYYQSMKTK